MGDLPVPRRSSGITGNPEMHLDFVSAAFFRRFFESFGAFSNRP
jgi:hypothetical protein